MAGTISRGIKAPIIREGDDIVKIVADSVLAAVEQDGFQLHERDVICVTEAVVARADGNYASTEDIAEMKSLGVRPRMNRWKFQTHTRFKLLLLPAHSRDVVVIHCFATHLIPFTWCTLSSAHGSEPNPSHLSQVIIPFVS
ncbi:MAG: coenzyme F420-0:L-glutamate ligase [Anaerotignum faecicola]